MFAQPGNQNLTKVQYSIIVPVYNRPEEIKELLESLLRMDYSHFEVIVIEDGSELRCKEYVDEFSQKLILQYFYKPNTGPGDSRNYGARKAIGEYLIFFDSDCIIPSSYLEVVNRKLSEKPLDVFGGPDLALDSFTILQKAINYSMTSFLTTGGIRGHGNGGSQFQPRSFNMGVKRKVFLEVGGFASIHPGEDPDLSLRLKNRGLSIGLIDQAFVYHKRRTSLGSFIKQVYKFGIARTILMRWHPASSSLIYFAPSLALLGLVMVIILATLVPLFWWLIGGASLIILVDALFRTRNLPVALTSIFTSILQIAGYGWGFLKGYWMLHILRKQERQIFPEMFFDLKS